MSKISISIAAFLVAVGTGFILGGMMSSSVIKVCKDLQHRLPNPKMFSGKKAVNTASQRICAEEGFFYLGFAAPERTYYVSTPQEKKALRSRSSAGLLLIGCVGSLFSALFFTLSACYAEKKSEKCAYVTIKRNAIATLLQAINVSLVLCGLAIYTNLKTKTINDPNELASQLCQIMSSLSGRPQDYQFLAAIGPKDKSPCQMERSLYPPRPKYHERNPQMLLSLIAQTQKNGTKIENFNLAPRNSSPGLTILNSRPLHSIIRERRFSNSQPPRPLPQGINNFSPMLMEFAKEQPHLGYSFYLLWGGFIFHVFSLVLGIINWKMSLSYRVSKENCVVV